MCGVERRQQARSSFYSAKAGGACKVADIVWEVTVLKSRGLSMGEKVNQNSSLYVFEQTRSRIDSRTFGTPMEIVVEAGRVVSKAPGSIARSSIGIELSTRALTDPLPCRPEAELLGVHEPSLASTVTAKPLYLQEPKSATLPAKHQPSAAKPLSEVWTHEV
jgi:hypothetical protein